MQRYAIFVVCMCVVFLFLNVKSEPLHSFYCTFVPIMRNHQIVTLSNGLRIIHESSETDVVYCGFVVCAGTRDEDALDSGMAHFCEHLTFKGTQRRKSWQIANGLERVGGDLNAYTTKEATVYYAAVLKQDFPRAVDLLCDIVFHSVYPQREIDKEVEVICDEIKSYEDSPAELIFDEFEEMIFRGHPMGRSILGNANRLHEYHTEDALRFTQRYYTLHNMAFFVFGDVDFKRIERLLLRSTSDVSDFAYEKPEVVLPEYVVEEREVSKQTHQAHVMMGTRAYSAYDHRRIGLFLLNNLLGGPGMNSRLNVALREHNGLVYTVESFLTSYTDTGEWGVYFGCDEHDVTRCRRLVLRELHRLCDKPLSQAQLSAAKKQLKGQIGISCDNLEGYALSMGKTFAHYGHYRDVHRLYEQIDALTPEFLLQISQDIFNESQLTTLVYR